MKDVPPHLYFVLLADHGWFFFNKFQSLLSQKKKRKKENEGVQQLLRYLNTIMIEFVFFFLIDNSCKKEKKKKKKKEVISQLAQWFNIQKTILSSFTWLPEYWVSTFWLVVFVFVVINNSTFKILLIYLFFLPEIEFYFNLNICVWNSFSKNVTSHNHYLFSSFFNTMIIGSWGI